MRYFSDFILFFALISNTIAQSNLGDCPADMSGYLPPRLILGVEARVVFDIELNLRPYEKNTRFLFWRTYCDIGSLKYTRPQRTIQMYR